MVKLTDKEIIFCKEYLIDFNGQRAATAAGYSEKTARSKASQLLTKVNIEAYIKELKDSRANRIEMTSDGVLKELKNWIEGDCTDLMMLTATEIKELPPEVRRLITGFKRTVRRIQGTDEEEIQIEIKFIDKQKAMEMVAKHIGFFEADNEQGKQAPIVINLGKGTKPKE